MELEVLKQQMDALDGQMGELFAQRMELSAQIARTRQAHGMVPMDLAGQVHGHHAMGLTSPGDLRGQLHPLGEQLAHLPVQGVHLLLQHFQFHIFSAFLEIEEKQKPRGDLTARRAAVYFPAGDRLYFCLAKVKKRNSAVKPKRMKGDLPAFF